MSIASNRLKLLSILALFTLPLVLAALMFAGRIPLLTGETVNQGKLVNPPVPLDWTAAEASGDGAAPAGDLAGSWVILLPVPEACGPDCVEKATGLRQVHRATGREQQRIRVVLLKPSVWNDSARREFLEIYGQYVLLADPASVLQPSLQAAARQASTASDVLTSYLVDPLGNIMMAYDTADSETRMSKDLKRLLKWSKQDEN